MAPLSNASFIPKSPRPGAGRSRITKRIYVLSYVSYVLFFSALIVVVAVYVYSSLISKKLESSKASLNEQQQRFSQEQLAEVRELEKQMLLVGDLLDRSPAPSKLFTELEAVVSDKVAFTGASFKRTETDRYTYEFAGLANDFNDIIYQRDILNRSQLLASSELSTYDYSLVQEEGSEGSARVATGPTISFTFSDDISGSVIPYEPMMAADQNVTGTAVVSEPRSADSEGVAEEGVETVQEDVGDQTEAGDQNI